MSFRNLALALLLAVLTCVRARAQTPPVAEPAPAQAPEPESAGAAAARTAVARSKALFAIGDYGAALAELMRAQDLLEGDPRQADVLNNIAVCYERMFRYDLALTYYERYLRESTTATAEDRAEVEAVMTSLRDLLGTVRVTGQPGVEVWIDDRKLGDSPLEVLVPAGMHVIELRARDHRPERRELRVGARAVHTVGAQLERIARYRGLPTTYFWIGAGLTAAAAITGTAFGIAALDEHADGERAAARGLPADGEPARDLALRADIAFGAAAVLGVASTVLFFLTDWERRDERASELAPSVAVDRTSGVVSVLVTGTMP